MRQLEWIVLIRAGKQYSHNNVVLPRINNLKFYTELRASGGLNWDSPVDSFILWKTLETTVFSDAVIK